MKLLTVNLLAFIIIKGQVKPKLSNATVTFRPAVVRQSTGSNPGMDALVPARHGPAPGNC